MTNPVIKKGPMAVEDTGSRRLPDRFQFLGRFRGIDHEAPKKTDTAAACVGATIIRTGGYGPAAGKCRNPCKADSMVRRNFIRAMCGDA